MSLGFLVSVEYATARLKNINQNLSTEALVYILIKNENYTISYSKYETRATFSSGLDKNKPINLKNHITGNSNIFK